MFNIWRQVIKANDELYVVKRTIKETEKLDVEILKQYFNCDTVLRKDGLLYFTNKIETLEYE